jgi:5-(carboxyamino)imidazole ribonucleotide synthase
MDMRHWIGPGATIGVLGGGQLGRMFGIAARKMGYRVHTYESTPDSPAGQVSDREFTGSYSDEAALKEFVRSVDVITFEFENIPSSVIDHLAQEKPVYPRSEVLHICQNREREKTFLATHGYPHVPFRLVTGQQDLQAALLALGTPAVLKTADFGYDGKGQQKVYDLKDVDFSAFAGRKAILERWVDFDFELSVVCARGIEGELSTFAPAENVHRRHILDHSIVPARISEELKRQAVEIATSLASDLDVIGLIAVEFFLTKQGELLVNELAPRPHNSGHYTFDACVTSQFEQQLRAVCGLPLGSSHLLSPIVMVNLLGDLWVDGRPPNWLPVLRRPNAKLHIYGKTEGRPGRKMGHYCVLSPTVEEALAEALKIRTDLNGQTLR